MTTNDFEAASAVANLLKDLDRERQARVLRWVSESLGISLATEKQALPAVEQQVKTNVYPTQQPGSGTDIKSFVGSKDPKSDNQFAATVAYYYRFEAPPGQRADSITSETLQEATRLTGRSRLGDPGKTLRNAKDMGYLDIAERGAYKINTVGENLVAMTLPAQGRTLPPKGIKKKKGKR